MRLRSHVGRASMIAALLAATLTACGSDDNSSTDDDNTAAEESESAALVVYAGRNEDLLAPLLEQFSEETGVELDVRYGDTPALTTTLLEEGDNTPADVFISQDAGALGALSRAGMLTELPGEITGAVKADYTSRDASWVGLTGRARVFVYDSTKLSEDEVPGTVAAFTDEEWEGRVAFPPGNASFQSFITGFRTAEGDDAAREWLDQMAANDVQTFGGNGDVLSAVDSGAIEVGLINHYYIFGLIAEVGAENVTAALKFPDAGDPGALVNVTGAGVLSDHADAETLVSYLVSADAQTYFAEETHEYPLVDGVAGPEGVPALEEIQGPIEDLNDLDDLEASVQMIADAGLE